MCNQDSWYSGRSTIEFTVIEYCQNFDKVAVGGKSEDKDIKLAYLAVKDLTTPSNSFDLEITPATLAAYTIGEPEEVVAIHINED